MGPSWFGLSSGFCVAFQAPLNLNSYYYDYYYYCFIIIFIISHLDLCFTNDRILKHQIDLKCLEQVPFLVHHRRSQGLGLPAAAHTVPMPSLLLNSYPISNAPFSRMPSLLSL